MTLFLLSFAAGALTLLSPCILPVLPFVLAGAHGPFRRGALPVLLGMAGAFTCAASLTALGGEWAARAGAGGRALALAWLCLLGLSLLLPALATRLASPLVALGQRLLPPPHEGERWWPRVLTGIATGLLWAPCAGPILGLVLTGAALGGLHLGTSLQLLAFAAGAACALALALAGGARLTRALRRASAFSDVPRRVLGALVLLSAAALASGVSERALLQLPSAATATLEETLLRLSRSNGGPADVDGAAQVPEGLERAAWWGGGDTRPSANEPSPAIEGLSPGFGGATAWLNAAPGGPVAARGRVTVVSFWTYSCINCLRTLPYVRAWAERYAGDGLAVVGVHTPEFAFEKDAGNVARAAKDLKVAYPVALDNGYRIWRAFGNHYWPAIYVVDAQGRIRHHQFGEGGEQDTERVIQSLLQEGPTATPAIPDTTGVGLPADPAVLASPETYLGYDQASAMAPPGAAVRDQAHRYAAGPLGRDEWALAGLWTVGPEFATLDEAGGQLTVRFHARDLHLVMGRPPQGAPLRFVLTIDGQPPGDAHGVDVDAQGHGTVDASRLYQLVRQPAVSGDRRVEIRFLDPGVRAYAFTFG
ncbi:redoxin family protein [Piscinibacter gummiphilus]|uniref:Uncharacterized protein n=1 Tax=Piscinibacter gummiphilus TaxID=946333 RepID=A0A1W6L398_9BURK|nr:redoxin family protein [Piscinibacter gummiphilus]ARN18707.1 hypothetical protein A4W93_01550 [Piscinibacter gummiphilus]ATU63346.1 cytochrome C biogenesis protein [Piscinibacter gummiphilus]GLS95856.1 cytochrome C biogenesis protein DipZ [Piscinibacter gummiphilus]